jgi:hypothetical protein
MADAITEDGLKAALEVVVQSFDRRFNDRDRIISSLFEMVAELQKSVEAMQAIRVDRWEERIAALESCRNAEVLLALRQARMSTSEAFVEQPRAIGEDALRDQHYREALESAAKMLEAGKYDYAESHWNSTLSDAWMDAAGAVRNHRVSPR